MTVTRICCWLVALFYSLSLVADEYIIQSEDYDPFTQMTELWLKGDISKLQIRDLALQGRYQNDSVANSAHVSFFLDEMHVVARGSSVSGRSAQVSIQVDESIFDLDYDLVSMHMMINGHGHGLSSKQKFLLVAFMYRLAAEGWSKSSGADEMEKHLIYRTLNYLSEMPPNYKMWVVAKEIHYPLH
ncbi:hypothetical protein ACJJIF_04730 [Microbulbifer sp. SSSA002]|uniref:hypothetical protein n=1 Tax=unclassified Microbulbifer TaxID=2619833 RepID=UPI0040397C43